MDELLNNRGSLVRERKALWPYWLILALVIKFGGGRAAKGIFRAPGIVDAGRSPLPWRRQPA